jgi:predicted ferric reductase
MTASPSAGAAPRPVPLPRHWGIRPLDIAALLLANGAFIVLMWFRHGGLDELGSPGGAFTAAGQLTALLGTYLALIQLVLMSRSPWLDEAFGMDRLAAAHRWLGFATVWLIGGHGVLTTIGYAFGDGATIVGEAITLLTTFPYVLLATAGFALFVMVGVSSMRAARRRLSYETWFGLHLYAYLAIALAFLHQLFVGGDFMHDQLAAIYWIGLYLVTVALVIGFRFGQPLVTTLRHRFRVAAIVQESPDVVSLYLDGRQLDRLAVRSGQYFVLRFLTRDDWWRAHPYSISSAPNGRWLRFTIKNLGDDSGRVRQLAVGTRVFVEGPYGVLTGARRTRPAVTLIGGGIGITPLRALLESLAAAPGQLTLIYRTSGPDDLVFRHELDALARLRGARIHYLVGSRSGSGGGRLPAPRLDAATIARLVPGIASHDVYLCGPEGLMDSVSTALDELGVPRAQRHVERFGY